MTHVMVEKRMDEGAGGRCDQAITSSERRTLRLEAYAD